MAYLIKLWIDNQNFNLDRQTKELIYDF